MDELTKQKAMFSFIAFNLGVVLFQLVFNTGLFGYEMAWSKFLLAILFGAIVGGITFGIVHVLQK
jgi:hypothetical protein